MNKNRTIERARIVDRLMLKRILPEEYELTASQIEDIHESCGGNEFDLITKAFCFGFYQAADFFLRDLHKEVQRNE